MPSEFSRAFQRALFHSAQVSRRWFFRPALLMLPLLGLAGSWLAFPVLEAFHLGYTIWRLAVVTTLLAGPAGWMIWLTERLAGSPKPSLFWLPVYGGVFALGVLCLFFGDFYWAFDRGFFLD